MIAIIAILAGVFLTGFGGFRQNAQDSRRIADLSNIRNYLESYYAKHRYYPATLNALTTNGGGDIGISSIPSDPAGGASYFYAPDPAGGATPQGYVVGATLNAGNAALTDPADVDGQPYGIDCDGSIYCLRN